MAAIFLNMQMPNTGEEVFRARPFRAFAKFTTKFGTEGGVAVLKLEADGVQVGTATIDWPNASQEKYLRKGRYYIATGALDEVDISSPHHFGEESLVRAVIKAMEKAGWTFEIYDPSLSAEEVAKRFAAWIETNL